jgi:hypothetical protein
MWSRPGSAPILQELTVIPVDLEIATTKDTNPWTEMSLDWHRDLPDVHMLHEAE